MSVNTKRKEKSGQLHVDEGIGDEDQLKSNETLSEKKLIHGSETHAIDREIVPDDNGNTHHLSSGRSYKETNILADYEHQHRLVLGNDVKDTIEKEQEQDDGVVSGDDDNETVVEEQVSVHPFFLTDREDISFSFKNLIPCIGEKPKNEDKTTHVNIHTGDIPFEYSRGGGHFVDNKAVANSCFDPDQYIFSQPHKGHAVLIVNQEFRSFEARTGAGVDIQKTLMVLQKLGFSIINTERSDLDKQSTLRVLRHARSTDHSFMDSFAIIMSSHGNEIEHPINGNKEHAIYCSDDQYIFTNDILDMFSDDKCPSLKGKPKMFFIQACRGTNIDPGNQIMVDGRYQYGSDIHNSSYVDGKKLETLPRETARNVEANAFQCLIQGTDEMDAKSFEDISDQKPLVRCNNDCLIMYAIPSGYFAWRSNTDGSWMLHYLWEEVQNYNLKKPCSFLKVLTGVSRKMAERETNVPNNTARSGMKAIPVIIH